MRALLNSMSCLFLFWKIVVAILIIVLIGIRVSHPQTLEVEAKVFVEAVKNGNTIQAVSAITSMSERAIFMHNLVADEVDKINRFVEPLEAGLNALNGDARELSSFQEMLDRDINAFGEAYQFDELKGRDYGLVTSDLEKMNSAELIETYASVSAQAEADIVAYKVEISEILDHREELSDLIQASELAEFKGVEVEKLLGDLNDSGISILSRTDIVWMEFSLYIGPRLSSRTSAIREAEDRLQKRQLNLELLLKRSEKLRESVDASWWWETFREGAANSTQTSIVPGMEALETAGNAGESAGSDASSEFTQLIARTIEVSNATKTLVERLTQEAAKMDREAAKSSQISNLIGLVSAIASGIAPTLEGSNKSENSVQQGKNTPIKKIGKVLKKGNMKKISPKVKTKKPKKLVIDKPVKIERTKMLGPT